jgi:hypothetical protein
MNWERQKGSKIMRSLYAAFYRCSMAQLWPWQNLLYQTEQRKVSCVFRAEGASERAAALALKRDVAKTLWA